MTKPVVIVGGGPAGSAMGCYLKQANIPVVIFEKEVFPREHVGESLAPICNEVLHQIGVFDKIKNANFPIKKGAIWVSADQREKQFSIKFPSWAKEAKVKFAEFQNPDVDLSTTFQVERAKFDTILLEHAQLQGCDVHQGTAVTNIEFHHKGATVNYEKDGTVQQLEAACVIDASGRSTLLATKFKHKKRDPYLNQVALHSWFKVTPTQLKDDYEFIKIRILDNKMSWIWQIPLNENTVSYGVVGPKDFFPNKKEEWEDFFWKQVETDEELKGLISKEQQLKPFTLETDYSYKVESVAGDRYLLIGDAARFVDPIFSSGVSIALKSAQLASKVVIDNWQAQTFDLDHLHEYANKMSNAIQIWYRFIKNYYRLNSLFSYFLNKDEFRSDLIRYLHGDLYSDTGTLMDKMDELIHLIETNKEHPLHDDLLNLNP